MALCGPVVLGNQTVPRQVFLPDESDDDDIELQESALFNSSGLGMSESESFVSESSEEIACDPDFENEQCRDASSDDEDRKVISSAPAANMCIITGEYSSSYSDEIEGLDTDIPALDPCEDFVVSVTKSNIYETSQENPEDYVI